MTRMCLAIYAPVGVRIARERLSNGWNNNPDGGGYAFINGNGEVEVRKYMDWTDFIAGYERDSRANTKTPFILHERFATHGTKDEENIHPFAMDDQTVVIHNGILRVNMKQDKRSDTRTFVEDYLAKLPMGWMDDPDLCDMVEDFIGLGNKLVILTSDPYMNSPVYIFGQKRGHWDRGAWWSNDGYKPAWESKKWRGYGKTATKPSTPSTTSKSSGVITAPFEIGTANSPSKPASPIQTVKAGATLEVGGEGDWNDPRLEGFGDAPYPNNWRPNCWLCGNANDVGPVCFRCEWCTEHATEFFACDHMNDTEIVNAYVRFYTNMGDEDRIVHDAYVLDLLDDDIVAQVTQIDQIRRA